MAVTKLSNSGIKTGVLKYDSMLAGNPPYIPSNFDSIATITTNGSSSTLTFSNIPGTYAHLQLRFASKVTSTSVGSYNMTLAFNGDTGNNYSYHRIYGFSGLTAAGSGVGTGLLEDASITSGSGGDNLGGEFSRGFLDIYDYAKNKNKTARGFWGSAPYYQTASTNFAIQMYSLGWRNTAAVTSITITAATNFVSGCVFALYGISE